MVSDVAVTGFEHFAYTCVCVCDLDMNCLIVTLLCFGVSVQTFGFARGVKLFKPYL